jgi:hypothetical protein
MPLRVPYLTSSETVLWFPAVYGGMTCHDVVNPSCTGPGRWEQNPVGPGRWLWTALPTSQPDSGSRLRERRRPERTRGAHPHRGEVEHQHPAVPAAAPRIAGIAVVRKKEVATAKWPGILGEGSGATSCGVSEVGHRP